MVYRPPPQVDFWRQGEYTILLPSGKSCTITISLDNKRPDLRVESPLRPNVHYPAELVGNFPIYALFFTRYR